MAAAADMIQYFTLNDSRRNFTLCVPVCPCLKGAGSIVST